MLKRIGYVVLFILVFAVMLTFTSLNPDNVTIYLAFATVQPTVAVALTLTFVIGWAFGILCASIYVLRLLRERRKLRASLRTSESEVSSLRNLPIADAD